jgi:hypothetical protein
MKLCSWIQYAKSRRKRNENDERRTVKKWRPSNSELGLFDKKLRSNTSWRAVAARAGVAAAPTVAAPVRANFIPKKGTKGPVLKGVVVKKKPKTALAQGERSSVGEKRKQSSEDPDVKRQKIEKW